MSVPRRDPPFRAEHIGSLLRPRALKDAFRSHAAGDLDDAPFKHIVEGTIVDAIRLQESAGMRSITDGEFRRAAWSSGIIEALDGFGLADSLVEFRDAEGGRHRWKTCCATAPIRRSRGIARSSRRSIRCCRTRSGGVGCLVCIDVFQH